MKKAILLACVFFFAVSSPDGEPQNCSTFLVRSGQDVFLGHNLDESPELFVPGLVCINRRLAYREAISWNELVAPPREYEKTIAAFEKKPLPRFSWISRYGSVTFNSEGIDFPDGGMNEKGLAVFEMSLMESRYQYDPARPTLFMSLWIQHQLDNYATVGEVVRNAEQINLQGWSWHFFVADRSGDCAVIEFLEGELVVHRDLAYPVLCNARYARELERLKYFKGFGGLIPVEMNFSRLPRFVKAARMLKEFAASLPGTPKERAMQILDEIKIEGWNKWGILIDVKNMTFYFHTGDNKKLRYFTVGDADFSGEKGDRVLNMHADLTADVKAHFVDYTDERNLELTRERAGILFVERLQGLEKNGVNARIYAERFADYSRRMRRKKGIQSKTVNPGSLPEKGKQGDAHGKKQGTAVSAACLFPVGLGLRRPRLFRPAPRKAGNSRC